MHLPGSIHGTVARLAIIGFTATFLAGCGKEADDQVKKDGHNPCEAFVPPQVANSGAVGPGGTVMLTAASSLPGVAYEWTGPGDYMSTLQSPVLMNLQYPLRGYYHARVRDGACKSLYDSTRVVVVPPCGSIDPNTATVGSATWYFYTNVIGGPLGPNLYYGITATSSYGKLYIQFNRFSPPEAFNIFSIKQIPGVDTTAVSMRIDENGTFYEAGGGQVYVGDEGDSTVFTFCGVDFQSAGGLTMTVKAYLIRS